MINLNSNIPSLKRIFERMPKNIDRVMPEAIKRVAFLIERDSKQFAPVDTGRLRSSIYTEMMATSATVQPNVVYALYVHEGTRYMRGRPFMKQGLESAKDKAENTVQKVILDNLIS